MRVVANVSSCGWKMNEQALSQLVLHLLDHSRQTHNFSLSLCPRMGEREQSSCPLMSVAGQHFISEMLSVILADTYLRNFTVKKFSTHSSQADIEMFLCQKAHLHAGQLMSFQSFPSNTCFCTCKVSICIEQ